MKKKAIASILAVLLTFGAVGAPTFIDTSVNSNRAVSTIFNSNDGLISASTIHAHAEEGEYWDGTYYKFGYESIPFSELYSTTETVIIDGEKQRAHLTDIQASGMELGLIKTTISHFEGHGEDAEEIVDSETYEIGIIGFVYGVTSTSIDLTTLNNVKFPDSVATCPELDNTDAVVSLKGRKITSIGQEAFCNATYLKEIELGNYIQYIGNGAFSGLKYITVIDIPSSVINMGQEVFKDSGVKTVNFHNKMTHIPDGIFQNTQLSKVTFDNQKLIKYVGDRAFQNSILTSFPITETSSPLYVGIDSFADCTQMATVTLPDSTEFVAGGAFQGCTALKSVDIGKGCKIIGGYMDFLNEPRVSENGAFKGCKSLTTITLNSVLQFMGPETFMNCTSLVNAPKMPSTLVFESYDEEVMPEPGHQYLADSYDSMDGGQLDDGQLSCISSSYCRDIFKGCTALKKIELPANCTAIPEGFCADCTSLTTVVLDGTKVDKIYNDAFVNCKNLQEFAMLDFADIIGARAFMNCENLRDVAANNNNNIFENAYDGCNALKSINVKSGVFLNSVFANCKALQTATLTTDSAYGHYILSGCPNLTDVNLNRDRKYSHNSLYAGAFIWGGGQLSNDPKLKSAFVDLKGCNFVPEGLFANDTAFVDIKDTDLSSVEIVLHDAFSGCQSLESLSMPKVVIVEDNAFADCSKLTKICSGDITIQDYGNSSFANCKSLTQKINAEVSTVGNDAFKNSGIVDVIISGTAGNTLVIGDNAFANCDNLIETNVIIPDGVEYSIGEYIFQGCSNLTKSEFNGTEVPEGMYRECAALTNVTLTKANDLMPYAFFGCKNLATISGIKTFKTIDQEAFSGCEKITSTYADANTTYKGDSQYVGCSSIGSANVYAVTKNMFKDCIGLTTAKLSGDISVLYESAFDGCSSLSTINLDKVVEYQQRCLAGTAIKTLDIKNVNTIESGAFDKCKNLRSVKVIADSIGMSAFTDCESLSTVSLTTNTIGRDAFAGCGSIVEVEFPEQSGYTLREIDDTVFNSDLLFGVLIPSTVDSIGYHAFGYKTDGDRQEGFVVYGKANSSAESYASGEEFEFKDASKYDASKLMSGKKLAGDVDANGILSVVDVIKMQKWITKQSVTGLYGPNMDLNGDNVVDIFDLALLKRELIKAESSQSSSDLPDPV